MRQFNRFALFVLLSAFAYNSTFAEKPNPLELFEQRIVPIFRSPDPSSCVQCHLSSVDLKDYILPSSRDTFLALRDQGLVNVASVDDSKILNLISMGDQDADKLARRIHAKTRAAEYAAFAAWLAACCQDTELVNAKSPDKLVSAGPKKSDQVIRHNRKDRILDLFERNVWSQRMRCFPCHTPNEIDANNPKHKVPAKNHRDYVEQFGQRMNIFQKTPEATMRSLIASSRKTEGDDLPLINVRDPAASLLLLKPMAKLPAKTVEGKIGPPSSALPVSHVGGLKIHKDDHSYKAFFAWLQDYANTTSDGYESIDQLPANNWFPTKHVLRIKNGPKSWPKMSTIQLFIHQWENKADKWGAEPIAFAQSKVTPRRIINGSLFLLASAEQQEDWGRADQHLAPGRYLVKAYLDHEDRIATDPTLFLNDVKPDATVEITAKWQEGFKNAVVVNGEQLQLADASEVDH